MRSFSHLFALLLLVWPIPADAQAQEEGSLAADATPSELENALSRARESIESGTHSAVDLGPEYLTSAIASARLGDEAAAQRAFVVLLGLDPSFRLKGDVADEVRSPYLEARGFWSAHEIPLHVDAALSKDGNALTLTIVDPASLSTRLRIRAQLGHELAPQEVVLPVSREARVPLAAFGEGANLSYSLTLLDENGNRLWQLGNDEHPQRLAIELRATNRAASPVSIQPPPGPVPRKRTPLHAMIGGLSIGFGTVAVAAGTAAHLRRQRLAADWNAVRCEGPGTTRSSICADERRELKSMEKVAGALYGVGAVAIVTGTLLLWLRPRPTEQPRAQALRCGSGPSELSMNCELTF